MASSNVTGGVKTFQSTTREGLEEIMNTFLNGDGTSENPKKEILQAPQFFLSGGVYYAMLVYRTIN